MPSSARGRHYNEPARDPLTTIFFLLIYPIFFCLLTILHLSYYCGLKLVAHIQWQRHVFSETRQRPKQLFQTWRSGFGLWNVGTYTTEKASEERLLKRGNVVRTLGRLVVVDEDITKGKKAKKQKALAPRHLALVVASKPVHTRVFLYRALIGIFFRSKRNGRLNGKTDQDSNEENQLKYALDSAQIALRCCALTGIEEVSLFDEAGRLKRALAERQGWTLEWPLDKEWQAKTTEDYSPHKQQCGSTPSESLVSTPRSYSSALDYTPSLSKRPSSIRLVEDYEQTQDDLTSLTPRLRLVASLHHPSYSTRKADSTIERPTSNGYHSHSKIYHTKIKVNLLGPDDAKKAIARAASSIAATQEIPGVVDVKSIDNTLQAQGYPGEPDLLIIHGGIRRVRTLHGFPPWLVRLCEIYYDQNASPYHPLSSVSFEAAIASFSRSEQRYGR